MINKTEAETIAQAIHALRRDWPINSLVTLLAELRDYPLRDLAVALTYVALDQDATGNWVSKTPARVKEDGPWWNQHRRTAEEIKAQRDYQNRINEAKATIQWRTKQVRECIQCDEHGQINGQWCRHRQPADVS